MPDSIVMPDWNLVLIDVATAWAVVAVPRAAQARLLERSGLYSDEAMTALGIDERRTVDPVKHTSLLSTLLLPGLCSVANVPVLAAGKRIEMGSIGPDSPGITRIAAPVLVAARRQLAIKLWLVTPIVYLLQATLMALLMLLLATIYLDGAPVAARCGQLCLRLAVLNLVPLPPFDNALAAMVWRGFPPRTWWRNPLIAMLVLVVLIKSPALRLVDQATALGFFVLSRLPFGWT